MGTYNAYSQKEINYLEKYWGVKTLSQISKSLGRSKCGIQQKAKRLHLGASTNADEYITAHQVSKMLGNDTKTIIYWIQKKGLPARKRIMLYKKQMWMIHQLDLMAWLERNQNVFDSRKIIPFALGSEPEWLHKKRDKDKYLPKNSQRKWKSLESKTLLNMYQSGYRKKELAKIFGRSYESIERKLERLIKKVKGVLNYV
jgi:DNA-binding CsgD family transcriptional regulator